MNMFRNFKPAYWVYNFFKKSELKHNIPLYKKYGIKKKYFDSVSSKDFQGLDSPLNKYDKVDSADYIKDEPHYKTLPPLYQEAVKDWSEKGYVILRGFLSPEKVEAVNQEIDQMIAQNEVSFRYRGKKIMFAFHKSDLIKGIGDGDRLKNILNMLLSRKVRLFQSINFIKGSEQRSHSDAVHMSTFPEGNLIAAWIALEDITADNGPLHYYPGSHKLPYVVNSDFGNEGNSIMLGSKDYPDYEDKIEEVIQGSDLNKEIFKAKKGDMLIWHANLLHGGEKMNNPELTRKSMVFHYYAEDVICYHELTQRPSLMK